MAEGIEKILFRYLEEGLIPHLREDGHDSVADEVEDLLNPDLSSSERLKQAFYTLRRRDNLLDGIHELPRDQKRIIDDYVDRHFQESGTESIPPKDMYSMQGPFDFVEKRIIAMSQVKESCGEPYVPHSKRLRVNPYSSQEDPGGLDPLAF